MLLGGAVVLSLASPASADPQLDRGRALFTAEAAPACSVCHALADAGSVGAIGPNLDELAPDAERVAAAVSGGVGIMPAYGENLAEADIEALAAYVSVAAGGS